MAFLFFGESCLGVWNDQLWEVERISLTIKVGIPFTEKESETGASLSIQRGQGWSVATTAHLAFYTTGFFT